MTVSRWKVMAGVLGVSIGGLAAIAGQCPKPSEARTHRSDEKPGEVPKAVPPAGGAPTAPALPSVEVPPAAPAAGLPALPGAAPAGDPLKLPAVPAPGSGSAPVMPPTVNPPAGPSTAPAPVMPAAGTVPASPMGPKVDLPTTPPAAPNVAPPVAGPGPANPPAAGPAPVEFSKPAGQPVANPPSPLPSPGPNSPQVGPSVPPQVNPPAPQVGGPGDLQPVNAATPAAAPTATKFRILLRVGEGEPSFEVRSGDDLVMKVVCEKVDIKSPEKGQTLSAVTASGKVRFVGFGAEGTCDSLSFLAGTGEVSMSGNVKIQVKDKLGRVESELTTESIKYKIDASALPGTLKP
jgi:hypothetical protein